MNHGWVAGVKILNPFGYVDDDGKPLLPIQQLRALAVQERVLEIPIIHQLIHKQKPPAISVGEKADGGDHVLRVKPGGEEELVVKLALALERGRVHKLDGNGLSGRRQSAGVDGAEAALAKAGGEG